MNDRQRENYDLDQLLHPAQAFGHPSEVVDDPDLTVNEKRAILASWASDACAVEAAPDLRRNPGGPVVRFDEINARAAVQRALKVLAEVQAANTAPHDEKSWEILFGKKQFESR